MRFHTKYSIPIGRIAEMFDTGDINMIVKDGKLDKQPNEQEIEKAYLNFKNEFNELFNQKEIEKLNKNKYLILKSFNRTELFLTALYKGLILPHSDECEKQLQTMYFDEFNKECKTEKDKEYILERIEFYRSKRNDRVVAIEQKNKPENKQSFFDVIANTEIVLGVSIPETMLLMPFVSRYNLALQKVKQLESSKNAR